MSTSGVMVPLFYPCHPSLACSVAPVLHCVDAKRAQFDVARERGHPKVREGKGSGLARPGMERNTLILFSLNDYQNVNGMLIFYSPRNIW